MRVDAGAKMQGWLGIGSKGKNAANLAFVDVLYLLKRQRLSFWLCKWPIDTVGDG
jgi:hypothetical protein